MRIGMLSILLCLTGVSTVLWHVPIHQGPASRLALGEPDRATSSGRTDAMTTKGATHGAIVARPPAAPSVRFDPPGPNVIRRPLTLHLTLPMDMPVMLDIFDADGRHVRNLARGSWPAGEHVLTWDLRNNRGESIRPGLYFGQLSADGQSFTTKLTTVR